MAEYNQQRNIRVVSSNPDMDKKKRRKRRKPSGRGYFEDSAQAVAKQKRHKKFKRGFIVGLIIATLLLALAAFLYIRFYTYKSFELKNEVELSEGSFVGFERYEDNGIKYSRDGASYLDKSGTEVWVDTYEMKDPAAYVSGEYACVYDINGNQINIYSSEGVTGVCETVLPITKAVVSESGVCAVVLEDTDATYINFYKKDGSVLDISVKTLLGGDGYPADIALSPDGTQLIVAYEYEENGSFRGKVLFYDFSEIGKNVPNRLIGGFDEAFAQSMIARVRFINSTYSYVAADTGIYFFSSKNLSSPELIAEIPINTTIKTIFNARDHLGVVYENEAPGVDEEGNPTGSEQDYHLTYFKEDGSVELEKDFSYTFTNIQSDSQFIYLIDDGRLVIYNMAGNEKYNGEMAVDPELITSKIIPGRYVFSGSDFIKEYQFK